MMRNKPVPKVATIVLTWNSAEFIEQAIDSLLRSVYPTDILIVDNDSSDDTRAIIAKKHPAVRLVNSQSNLGYAGGNNFGIRLLEADKPDYIFILNPDASVDKNCIGKLVGRLEREKQVAAVSPLIYFDGSNDNLWFSGSWMKWRTGERIQIPTSNNGQFKDDGYTDFVNGCAMMIRVEAMKAVGMMDEQFFLYCEETDWSLRLAKQGYRIGLQGNATAWHKASASTGGFYGPLYQYYINRNRLLLIRKNRPGLLPIVAFSSLYMNIQRVFLIAKAKGARTALRCSRAIIKAYFDFAFSRFGKRY